MGVTDAPQWLLPAFVRSLRALGATASAEQVRSRGEHLIEQWSTPDRRFHNLRHLIDMLARVDELADESHSPDVMRVATWYHGCVFSTGAGEPRQHNGGENEEASAEVAVRDLSDLGVPEATTARVGDLIRNLTGHRLDTDDMDAAALADADLGALAVDPQTYKEYLRLLREEYAHVPLASYLETRLVIVGRLLEREKLFHSPLGEHWERPARQNLKAERQRLTEKLARLTPDEAGQHTECCPWQAEPASRRVPRSSDCSSSSLAEEPDDPRPSHDRSAALAGASTPTDESVAVQPPSPPLGAGDTSTVAEAESVTPHPSLTPPVATSSATAASASSPRTPATGVPRPVPPAADGRPVRPTARSAEEDPALSTSMESCAEDLDLLLAAPRSRHFGQAGPTAGRGAQAEAARLRLTERLREKAQEARQLREARTGDPATGSGRAAATGSRNTVLEEPGPLHAD
ncbi:hypothetical protein [Actinomyces sp. 2119]|uniref:HD domain-containing protein n=1 Tax=Actinomyces sp. 2119 TaxID=2321393 RepID=UPI002176044D|nr:hypothetical protein [Actinomyces sp. 2119]